MAMKFDATMKGLSNAYPADYLATFDPGATGPVRVLNVDLSTVSAAADLVLGLGDPLQEIVHIDFQAAAMADKHTAVLAYNGLLFRQFKVPVHSIVVLLRPSAAHSNLNGKVHYSPRPGRGSMTFDYELVRLWERSVDALLAGALGTLPLAVLGALPAGVDKVEALTAVARRIVERLEAQANPETLKNLLTAAYVLTGLRVPKTVGQDLFRGVLAMRESTTYQAILDEGREAQVREDIVDLATEKFGPADEATRSRLQAITDYQRLRRMHRRLLKATDWQDLLNTP